MVEESSFYRQGFDDMLEAEEKHDPNLPSQRLVERVAAGMAPDAMFEYVAGVRDAGIEIFCKDMGKRLRAMEPIKRAVVMASIIVMTPSEPGASGKVKDV